MKNIKLSAYQAQWVVDLVYEEFDRVKNGTTIYEYRQETLDGLQEIMDLIKDAQEDGA